MVDASQVVTPRPKPVIDFTITPLILSNLKALRNEKQCESRGKTMK
jgi:hypothetical protein